VFPDLILKLNEELAAPCLLVEGSQHVLDIKHLLSPGFLELEICSEFWAHVEAKYCNTVEPQGIFLKNAKITRKSFGTEIFFGSGDEGQSRYSRKVLGVEIFFNPKDETESRNSRKVLGVEIFSTPKMRGSHVTQETAWA
jgi:hypothetical protein